MGWKCVPQVMGLVRGEPKPGAKHRANGAAICGEAGKERHSASETLDRTRSKYNRYGGEYKTGRECWAAMEDKAEKYRVEGTSRAGKKFSRKLRGDAVIGWAVIFHPPESVAESWTKEKHRKFYEDSWRAIAEIEPRLFRPENAEMMSIHRDEGVEHRHLIGDALDKDGRYCGNLIDADLMVRINERYPAIMRRLGWPEIEDVEQTDFSRMGKNADGTYKDPEYRAKVKARKKGGKSVNEYAEQKARERREAAARMYEDAGKTLQAAQNVIQDAQEEGREIVAAAKREAQETALEARREADQDLERRERRVTRAEEAARNVRLTVQALQSQGLLHPDGTPKTRDELRREFAQEQQRQQQAAKPRHPERGHEFDGMF